MVENIYRLVSGTIPEVERELNRLFYEGYVFCAMASTATGVVVTLINQNAAVRIATESAKEMMKEFPTF